MESLLSTTYERGDTFRFERLLAKRGFRRIAGTDEVGRGPLAGPVVAAAVILPMECEYSLFCDSKKTTQKQRYRLRNLLINSGAIIGIGTVSAEMVDRVNVLQASLLAMREAILELGRAGCDPDFILVDGTFPVPHALPQETLVRGDCRSASIAAASIVAKITRDEMMLVLHERYPEYNFLANKGYPTKEHRKAVAVHGPCPIHRMSFKGVKEFVSRTD